MCFYCGISGQLTVWCTLYPDDQKLLKKILFFLISITDGFSLSIFPVYSFTCYSSDPSFTTNHPKLPKVLVVYRFYSRNISFMPLSQCSHLTLLHPPTSSAHFTNIEPWGVLFWGVFQHHIVCKWAPFLWMFYKTQSSDPGYFDFVSFGLWSSFWDKALFPTHPNFTWSHWEFGMFGRIHIWTSIIWLLFYLITSFKSWNLMANVLDSQNCPVILSCSGFLSQSSPEAGELPDISDTSFSAKLPTNLSSFEIGACVLLFVFYPVSGSITQLGCCVVVKNYNFCVYWNTK